MSNVLVQKTKICRISQGFVRSNLLNICCNYCTHTGCVGKQSSMWKIMFQTLQNCSPKVTLLCYRRKRSLRRLCFHRCLSVHRGVSQYALQVTWPTSSIKAAALLLGLSWCGGSMQVTSNAWWDRSHGTPPRQTHPCILNGSVRGRVSSSRKRFWTLPNLYSEVSM